MATFTEIAAKLVKLFTATDKYHDIVNGENNETVVVESGTLPTLSKAIFDFEAAGSTSINTFEGNGADAIVSFQNDGSDAIDAIQQEFDDYIASLPFTNFAATVAPTAANDSTEGYAVGSKWYDTVAKEAYTCLDASVGSAVWVISTLDAEDLGDAAFLTSSLGGNGAADDGKLAKFSSNGELYAIALGTTEVRADSISNFGANGPPSFPYGITGAGGAIDSGSGYTSNGLGAAFPNGLSANSDSYFGGCALRDLGGLRRAGGWADCYLPLNGGEIAVDGGQYLGMRAGYAYYINNGSGDTLGANLFNGLDGNVANSYYANVALEADSAYVFDSDQGYSSGGISALFPYGARFTAPLAMDFNDIEEVGLITADMGNFTDLTVVNNPTTADGVGNRNYNDARYGQFLFAVKSADTSRSSTTAYADDTHLTIAIPTTGLWLVELECLTTAADGTGGVKMQLAFTGTTNTTGRTFFRISASNQGVAMPTVCPPSGFSSGGSGTSVVLPRVMQSITNRTTATLVTALLEVTATGTLSVQWAQNTSSATATIMPAGCYMKATRVGS